LFERFTERARQVVVLAQDEARNLKHNYIGTEHLLLGVLREEKGFGARALADLGVRIEEVRAQIARVVGEGDEVASGQIPFTPRAKKALEMSLREARSLGSNYIGTEHILLGIADTREGVAERVLLEFDVDAERIRAAVMQTLGGQARFGTRAVPGEEDLPPALPRSRPPMALLGGWVLFGVSLGIGILIGWAIWGL
jgi:ATP-dependent Clp protease ATP-binding subunit ClpC